MPLRKLKPKKIAKITAAGKVSKMPAECPINQTTALANCSLLIELYNNVNVTGLHLFARKFASSKQVRVSLEKKQVVLNYGNQLVACCYAYSQLVPAKVVKSVDLIQPKQWSNLGMENGYWPQMSDT